MPIQLKYFENTCIVCNNTYVDNIIRSYCADCFQTIDFSYLTDEVLENIEAVENTQMNILNQFYK